MATYCSLSFSKPTSIRLRAARMGMRPAARTALLVRADKVLIANTKGGGHAPFGLYLAKELVSKGHQVTILNDGDRSKLEFKEPFSEYGRIGVDVVWGNPSDPSTYPTGTFDIVYDNNGKDLENCAPMIDTYGKTCKQYCYVSSAGMCNPGPFEPTVYENSKCKEKGHYFVEQYLKEKFVPYTVFRPLYPYGKFTMKDCEQWFMDRIVRDRPILIPGDGSKMVSLSHYEDCGKLMAAALNNWRAKNTIYNLTADAKISFDGVALACAKAIGKEANIVHYDAEKYGKGSWPFRLEHFIASSVKAQAELEWKPEHDFATDMVECYQRYQASGRASKDLDFSKDDEILKQLGVTYGASSSFW